MDDFSKDKIPADGQAYGAPGSAPRLGYNPADNLQGGYGASDNTQGGYGSVNNTQSGYGTSGNTQTGYGAAGNTQGGYGSANSAQGGYGSANYTAQNGYAQTGYTQNGYDPANGYGTASGTSYDTGYSSQYDREAPQNQSQAVSIVSLVFGILSVVCCWTFVLPFIFGIVAIICGIVGAVKHQKKALWIIGIIAGALGIVITIAMVVSMIPLMMSIFTEIERRGGDITPQDIQRLLREYGIEVNLGVKLLMTKFF